MKPSQIGIVIVNCSLFVPTPSWCAHIQHSFKMRSNVLSFNLGGMGCSGELTELLAAVLTRRHLWQLSGLARVPGAIHVSDLGSSWMEAKLWSFVESILMVQQD